MKETTRTQGQRGKDLKQRAPGGGRKAKPEKEKVKTYGVQLTPAQNTFIEKKYGSRTKAIRTLLTILCLMLTFALSAQTATKTKDGNYIATQKQDTATTGKPTGKTFTDKSGKVYPLFISKNGKLYYTRVSKAGNTYKAYLKVD